MKKIATLVIATMCLGALAACNNGTSELEVAVFGPDADHGWTGAVLSDIQDKAKELNASQSKYNYVIYADGSAEDQAKDVQDVLARKSQVAGIVIQPSSNEAEGTITTIANSGLPFVQFDRIISNDTIDAATNAVSDVTGDNYSTGVASAQRFIQDGMAVGDKILLMPGDNSSVPAKRTQGFEDTLKKNGWTDADIASDVYSTDYTNWSRDTSITLYQDFVGSVTDLSDYKWYYTHDSEITMGILNAVTGSIITDANKAIIKNSVKGIVGCGGLEEVYQVIRGDHPRSAQFTAAVPNADIVDVTYDPAMMATAMQDMADYLDGKTVTKDHVIASEAVDKDNIGDKVGFGGDVTE